MAVMACYCVVYVLTQSTHRGEQLNGWNSRCHNLQAGEVWRGSVEVAGQTQCKYWEVRSDLVIPCKCMIIEEPRNYRHFTKRIVYSHLEITTVIIFATLLVSLYAHTEAIYTYSYLQKCRYTYFTACFFPIKKILWGLPWWRSGWESAC